MPKIPIDGEERRKVLEEWFELYKVEDFRDREVLESDIEIILKDPVSEWPIRDVVCFACGKLGIQTHEGSEEWKRSWEIQDIFSFSRPCSGSAPKERSQICRLGNPIEAYEFYCDECHKRLLPWWWRLRDIKECEVYNGRLMRAINEQRTRSK